MSRDAKNSPLLKAAIDYVPLVLFMLAYFKPDIFRPLLPASLYEGAKPGLFVATAVMIPSTFAAMAASWLLFHRIPVMLWATAAIISVLGALTFYLNDPNFIKMKLTLVYTLFGGVLLGGLAFNKVFLPMVLDGALKLDDRGWRILTVRWGCCFLVMAALNEFIRRTQSDDVWVYFKFPGTAIVIFGFMMTQIRLIIRHEVK